MPGTSTEIVGDVEVTVVLDGKPHEIHMRADEHVLDAALQPAWICLIRARWRVLDLSRSVLEGSVEMDKNFGLESWETDKGFVLSCQARPTCNKLTVSFDER